MLVSDHMTDGSGKNHVKYDCLLPTVWAKASGMVRLFLMLSHIPEGGERLSGRIHSLESMGLVDGPGVRVVVFMQGCRLRCRYCHNPDTWDAGGGEEVQEEALLARILRFRPYFERSGGGVTFSGGEPLMQPSFLLSMLRRLNREGIHVCLDTAGVGCGEYDEILRYTDLVLYDVKHVQDAAYRALTGRAMDGAQSFVDAMRRMGTPMWVRHVVVPGLTDARDHMQRLAQFVRTLPNVQRVELLPYHRLGMHKYAALSLPYTLGGVPDMDAAICRAMQKEFFGEQKEGKTYAV